MPTNAINDTGVKYLYDKLHGEIEPIAEAISDSEVTIEGNSLSFNTLSSQNAKSTILSVEPIQDLHGYDKPWVGGAGKNLLYLTVADIKSNNSSDGTWSGNTFTKNDGTTWTILTDNDNNVIGIKVNGTSNADSLFLVTKIADIKNYMASIIGKTIKGNGCPANGSISTYFLNFQGFVSNGVGIEDTGVGTNEFTVSDFSSFTTVQVYIRYYSGTVLNNLVFQPMLRLSTETDATFQPYTNIASISGRSEIGILGCGKNLLPMTVDNIKALNTNGSWSGNTYSYRNVTIEVKTDNNGNVNGFKLNGTSNNEIYFTIYLGNFAEGNYIGSKGTSEVRPTFSVYSVAKSTNIVNVATSEVSFTVDSQDANDVSIFLFTPNAYTYNNTLVYPMIRLATETDSNFEPYTESNNLTINLGQTVYGGTLDVENGVLVVDRKGVDMGSLTWTYHAPSSNYTAFFDTQLPNDSIEGESYEVANIISPLYKTIRSVDIAKEGYDNGVQALAQSSRRFITCDQRYSDETNYTNAVNGNILVYELATPITIQLTPNEISLLEGVNNISTTGDKITLTYRDGKVATLGDLTSAVDNLDSKIDESKILTDTVTGDKYKLVVTSGVLSIEQISN